MATIEDLSQYKFPLNNGSGEIPALGFGTSLSDNTKTRNAVEAAVEIGFRHLDAAERYRNEAEVGAALKELFAAGTVRRDDLFVTTKLWNNNHRPERVKPALQASLDRLGLDAVDLYLVHTPFAFKPGDDQDPRHRTELSLTTTGSLWRRPGPRWRPSSMTGLLERSACPISTSTALGASSRPPDQAGGRRGRVAPVSPAMGSSWICQVRGDHPAGIRFVGARAGTKTARRPARRLNG